MISRRNIRVKVMQTLYSLSSTDKQFNGHPEKLLQKQIDSSRQLFVYLLHFLTEVARYSETDAMRRASKNLPTADDLAVNTRFAGNTLLWKILEDSRFIKAVEEEKPNRLDNSNDLVKKIYLELTETEEYKKYIQLQARESKSEKEILVFVFTDLMLPSEAFTSHLEEHFPNWDDDADMMRQLMLYYLSKPSAYNINEFISKEKWQFAKTLLQTVLDKQDYILEITKPKLKNWDADRLATLDMILIEMGLCELLYFDTIPTKVTINEYIDLAKAYSTPQSGHFVNGILDSVHLDLVKENKIHKVSHKEKA